MKFGILLKHERCSALMVNSAGYISLHFETNDSALGDERNLFVSPLSRNGRASAGLAGSIHFFGVLIQLLQTFAHDSETVRGSTAFAIGTMKLQEM